MIKKKLLIEIGTEELPSRLLYKISSCFYDNVIKELQFHKISYKTIELFFTPRRLALKIIDIDASDRFKEIKKRGPSIIDAYDINNLPTKSAIGWAKHCGINLNQATRIKTQKGEWLLYHTKQKQKSLELLIPKITELALKKIIIEKSMRWELKNEKFFRPIRNIVMMLDNQIISGKIFNVLSNNILHNHLSLNEKKNKNKKCNRISSHSF